MHMVEQWYEYHYLTCPHLSTPLPGTILGVRPSLKVCARYHQLRQGQQKQTGLSVVCLTLHHLLHHRRLRQCALQNSTQLPTANAQQRCPSILKSWLRQPQKRAVRRVQQYR